MILWGAFWGGVIAAVLGPEVGSFAVIGAAIGAVIGFSLRAAIRKEVAAQFAQQASAVAATPGAMDAPRSAATDEDAQASPGRPDPAAEVPPMPVDAGAVARPSAIASDDAGAPEAATGPRPWRVQAAATENIAWVGHAVDKAKAWLLGGNTIVRLGMLVLFVGLAFLAKYAADNSMLPPELRLAGIGCAGIALFVFGFRLRNRHPDKMAYALSLQGGGVAVLYLTVFAAFRLYQFLPLRCGVWGAGRDLRVLHGDRADAERHAHGLHRFRWRLCRTAAGVDGCRATMSACSPTTCCWAWPLPRSPGCGPGVP